MRYLFDTHTILWLINDYTQLSSTVTDIYLDDKNTILISMVSIWEITIKIKLKKLSLKSSLSEFIREHIKGNRIDILNIELSHLYQLENLPLFHRDPFDRLIIGQAVSENIPVVSRDKAFDDYQVQRIW